MISEATDALIGLATSRDDRFTHLVKVSGLDPSEDFRFCDLSGADLRGEDLSKFDFTGAKFNAAKIHGATFNGTVKRAQLDRADPRNYATVVMIGYAGTRVYRDAVRTLPRDFTFDMNTSMEFDDFRGRRDNPRGAPFRSDLLEELMARVKETDVLFVLLASPSIAATDLAIEIQRRGPKGKVVTITVDPEMDRNSAMKSFIRFRTTSVDGSWSRGTDIDQMCRFLSVAKTATPIHQVPWNGSSFEGPGRYQPTIFAFRDRGRGLGENIRQAIAYESWGDDLTLRLFIAKRAYRREEIVEVLRGRVSGKLEVYSFDGTGRKDDMDAYALLAPSPANIWSALPKWSKKRIMPAPQP